VCDLLAAGAHLSIDFSRRRFRGSFLGWKIGGRKKSFETPRPKTRELLN
jgi:hypothetical protein